MKTLVIGSLVAGVIAAPALAGSSAVVRELNLNLNAVGNEQMSGYGYDNPQGGGPAGALANLYQNIPVAFGGLGTAGGMTPDNLTLMYFFVRWTQTPALYRPQWGDDLHGISVQGGGQPAIVTAIQYGYTQNGPLTVPHIIKLYDMVPPSEPHINGSFAKGPLLRQITFVAPPITMGALVTLPIAPLQLPSGSIWIKFDQAVSTQNTFWLSGGVPYGGSSSHGGLTLTYKNEVPTYNYYYEPPNGIFSLGGTNRMLGNIAMGLRGFHVPAPAVISLLGLGGLAALRRRRAA